jgi:hypothetical protein
MSAGQSAGWLVVWRPSVWEIETDDHCHEDLETDLTNSDVYIYAITKLSILSHNALLVIGRLPYGL